MEPLLGIIALAGEYEVGFSEAPKLLGECAGSLESAGVNIYNCGVVMYDLKSMNEAADKLLGKDLSALLVCVGTWSEDHHLLDLLGYIEKPVILWAFPNIESGSMCGVHQICSVFTDIDQKYYAVYGNPDDAQTIDEIRKIAKTIKLAGHLKRVRIGSVGGRIKGMTEIAFDEFAIKKKTGVRIINLDESELLEAAKKIPIEKANQELKKLYGENIKISSAENHMIESLQYYLGMKNLINEYALEGIVVKCYPNYMGKVCLGYSLLSEEGIVCGCEGDVNSTVMMKILYDLTGQPIHNTDILYAYTDDNSLLFSHCGSGGFSLAATKEEIDLAPVRLADSGVCALFTAKTGIVTLANLVGAGENLRMCVMTGQAVPASMDFPGNPLKVKMDKDVLEINRQIAKQGTGHHWMAGYGDVSDELEAFCEMNDIKFCCL